MIKLSIYIVLVGTCIVACKNATQTQIPSDSPVLAEVSGSKLYLEEIEDGGLLTNVSTKEDSIHMIDAYVQKWIKDQLMLSEAEKLMSDDINIDMLVRDYKESLLLYNYEMALIRDRLDTVITEKQIEEYYKNNGEIFRLSESIIRCRLVVIDGSKAKLDQFFTDWKSDKMDAVNKYVEENASIAMLDDEKWYSVDEILSFLPEKITEKDLKKKSSIQMAANGNEYFVKILKYIDKSEDPPLAYVSSNIKKIILHNRKSKLMIKLKEDLYQREINGSKVRIYQK